MATRAELEKIPYIDKIPSDGRIIYGQLYYDEINSEFKDPFSNLKIISYVKKPYWSKKIVDNKSDIHLNLINLLGNNLSYQRTIELCDNIEQDIFNFGALIHKQRILWDYYNTKNDLQDVYITEIEYLMGLIRSFYELLWDVYKYLLNCYGIKIPGLRKKSLGSLCDNLFDRENRTPYKSYKKYELNTPLIRFLIMIKPIFMTCRKFRDDIYHNGRYPPLIFPTENGPAISMKKTTDDEYNPFHDFKFIFHRDSIYQKNLLPNEICSLFYFELKLIDCVLNSAELFAQIIRILFKLPEAISKDYKLYLRGPEIEYINKIPDYLKKYWIETK